METLALVLACDFSDDTAQAIGQQTIRRLEGGLAVRRATGARLMVAAGWSPHSAHRAQQQPMAVLMAAWLKAHGCERPLVRRAGEFNTRGELTMLYTEAARRYAVVTAWWHLPRTRRLARQVATPAQYAETRFVPVYGTGGSPRQVCLELPKFVLTVLPARWQWPLVVTVRHLFGNTSY